DGNQDWQFRPWAGYYTRWLQFLFPKPVLRFAVIGTKDSIDWLRFNVRIGDVERKDVRAALFIDRNVQVLNVAEHMDTKGAVLFRPDFVLQQNAAVVLVQDEQRRIRL